MVAVFSCGQSGRVGDCSWEVSRGFLDAVWVLFAGRSTLSARVPRQTASLPLYEGPWPGGRISADKKFSTGAIHVCWLVS